jgi:heat shock protein HslJ
MPDDREPEGQENAGDNGRGGPKGIMVSLAVVLMAVLVLLVIYMNMSGQGAAASATITENTWSLRSFAGPDGTVIPLLNDTVINASFRTDGLVRGSGGCNGYSARYMVRETQIVISRVTTTDMACWDNNATLQEMRYYNLLEDAAELRVHDRDLTLYGTDGKPLLVYGTANPGD